MIHEPDPPDIVKVDIGRRDIQPVGYEASSIWQEEIDPGLEGKAAVMEINVAGIWIKATNQVNPQILAEVIRLIGGIQGC
jgi:hypothetical protein